MSYVLPQVQVFQQLNNLPTSVAHPLNAHITAPNGQLVRYAQASEKELGFLGYYDPTSQNCFNWPNQPVGSVIDLTYTQVWIQNALLNYFSEVATGGGDVKTVANYPNQIKSQTVSFVANGATWPRSAQFNQRDVQVGDVAMVCATIGPNTYTQWTTVQGFIGDVIAASVGAAAKDPNNTLAQGFSCTTMRVSGPENCVSVQSDGTLYSGFASGKLSETYTIVVTQSSTHGDYTKALVKVISGSGTDNQAPFAPNGVDVYTNIGTRGLRVKFHEDESAHCSISAQNQGNIAATEMLVGQTWLVTVVQAFTPAVPVAAGTYTGPDAKNYIVTVTTGGVFSSSAEPYISVTDSNGHDISGPTVVPAPNYVVPIGTQGVTLSFTGGTGLNFGHRFIVPVTPQGAGAMKTIVLNNNLNGNIPAGTAVDLTLFILKPALQVPMNRANAAPLTNWTSSATQICVNSAITAYDPTWTSGGVMLPLPVNSGAAADYGRTYVQYRAWLPALVGTFNATNDVSQISTMIPGQLDPDNPLAYGVFMALSNSNGSEVGFTAVSDPTSIAAWQVALQVIAQRQDVYGLVPLTHNAQVLQLWQAHVNEFSSPTINEWRAMWVALQDVPTKAIVSSANSTDGNIVLATISDNPYLAGIQYSYVSVPALNGQFITNGVAAGDVMRFFYTGDGFGNYTYTEFVIAQVVGQDALILQTAYGTPISTPSRMEVWRYLAPTDEATAIQQQAGVFASSRVRCVWPDTFDSGSSTVDGYYLCCALAGLRSGVVPQQGLTNLEIAGITSVPRTVNKFNRDQLDQMAGNGVWIVTSDPNSGKVYSRHAVTSGAYAILDQREEMIVSNIDSISYRFAETFAPFIGVVNAVPTLLNILTVEGQALIEVLKSELFTPSLGGQIIDATITSIAISLISADTVNMTVTGTAPAPLNNFIISLSF